MDIHIHLTCALVLIVLAATRSGRTWALGRMRELLPVVQRNRWAL